MNHSRESEIPGVEQELAELAEEVLHEEHCWPYFSATSAASCSRRGLTVFHPRWRTNQAHQHSRESEIPGVEQELAELAEEVLHEEHWWPNFSATFAASGSRRGFDCFPPSVSNQPSS